MNQRHEIASWRSRRGHAHVCLKLFALRFTTSMELRRAARGSGTPFFLRQARGTPEARGQWSWLRPCCHEAPEEQYTTHLAQPTEEDDVPSVIAARPS